MPPRLRRVRGVFLSAVALLALMASDRAHAGPVDPPIQLLHARGNFLVAGRVHEINPTGRIVFQRKEVLSGTPLPPELIDVEASPEVIAQVKRGQRYLVGYSAFRRDRHLGAMVANLQGPTLLVSIGLEPALFADSRFARDLLKRGSSPSERESARFREQLLKALEGRESSLRVLAAGELALDPGLRDRLGGSERVIRVARDPRTPVAARMALLRMASTWPQQTGGWWKDAALEVVETTPVDRYAPDASDTSALVLDAFDALDQHGTDVAVDALARWLRSPSPALAERAALLLHKKSVAAEREAIRAALATQDLPTPTRRLLEGRQRQSKPSAAPPVRSLER